MTHIRHRTLTPILPRSSGRGAVAFACSVMCCLLGGCGYSHNGTDPAGGYQWRSLYREDIQTVAVEIFQNTDFRRGEEFQLTKAVVNQLESRTPYKVVPKERADTILEGQITSIHVNTLSQDRIVSVPQEQLYIVNVDFTWKDLRSGRILVERRNFEQTTAYYPTLGEGEFVGSQQAAERMAAGIVQELQADW
jgi:Lipopolysaccharide-assembly